MNDHAVVDASQIRADFAHAMSKMYQVEVPQYEALIDLVETVNAQILDEHPARRTALAATGELDRLRVERHGAIRVGTAEELGVLRRLFAVMGMLPVGYYDLSVAGIPVHSTAFRPVETTELNKNPFRLFTSLLRLDLIENVALRKRAAEILAARDIFSPQLRRLIDRYEHHGGLTSAEARDFVAEAVKTFQWHDEATVDYATYRALLDEHPLIADVVCFCGPHINHLTPRTLDIDAIQAAMPMRGIVSKAIIEGPPRRKHPILLRQTSFKALNEPICFGGGTAGCHTARFGEVEQRGMALTPAGRALYDSLLLQASEAKNNLNNAGYQVVLEQVFADFPDDEATLRTRGLAFYRYTALEHPVPEGIAEDDVSALLDAGCLRADPIVYEDFLPVSAAGIFRSNLGDDVEERQHGNAQRQQLIEALGGVAPLDEMALYEQNSRASLDQALRSIQRTDRAAALG